MNIAKVLRNVLKNICERLLWKSAPQWQIYRRGVIPEFYYPFKTFSIPDFAMTEWFCHVTCFAKVFLLLFFFSQTWCFYHKKVLITHYHFFIVEIIVESVNLIQIPKQIGKLYHHDGEQLGFYKKVHIKTQRLNKKKNVFVIFVSQETKNSHLFDKSGTQDSIKFHFQHEGSWLWWIVVEQVITRNTTFRLYFMKQIVLSYFQNLFRKSNRDAFWEKEDRIN